MEYKGYISYANLDLHVHHHPMRYLLIPYILILYFGTEIPDNTYQREELMQLIKGLKLKRKSLRNTNL